MRSIDSQFAYDTHQMMDLKSVRLSFSGEFTSDLVSVLLLLAKNNVGGRSVMKKVYNVMIESLENLIKHASIAKEVLFVGLGPTFQMWNPDNYSKKKIETIKIANKKNLSPRLKPIPKGI